MHAKTKQAQAQGGANMERPTGDYMIPTIGHYDSPICIPEEYDFEVKSGLIHMVKSDTFNGYGNPHYHLSNFTEICRIYKNAGIPQDVMYMKLFPFSLSDKAKYWLQSHEPNTFRTWEELAHAFLKQYFPPGKVKSIRDKIINFVQFDDESFYEAYERFKGLLRECPHHGFYKWELLSYFYDGMDENGRTRMDIVSGGGIMDLTPTEGFNIVERIARNCHQWGGERNHLKKYEKDSSSKLATKEDFNALTNTINALAQSLTNLNVHEMGEHDEDAYDSRRENFEEDVDHIAEGQDRYYIPLLEDKIANQYIPPSLQNPQGQVRFYADTKPSSSNQYYNGPTQARNQYQEVNQPNGQYFGNPSSNLNFNSRQYDEKREEPSLAQLMSQMIAIQAQQGKDIQLLTTELQQERAARKILELQLAQQASISSRNPEKFSSVPDVRLANANVITLKRENVFEKLKGKKRASTEVVEEDEQFEQGKVKEAEEQEIPYVAPPAYVPPIPFPYRQIKVPVETNDNYIDICQLTFFESKVLSNKHTKNSDTLGNNLTGVVKKSFHEGPEILICNTRLKEDSAPSLPGR